MTQDRHCARRSGLKARTVHLLQSQPQLIGCSLAGVDEVRERLVAYRAVAGDVAVGGPGGAGAACAFVLSAVVIALRSGHAIDAGSAQRAGILAAGAAGHARCDRATADVRIVFSLTNERAS